MSLVDVVVPAWNCEKYIARAIGSVINQSFEDFSLILIDDGSTDMTRDIIYEAAGQDSRIIPFSQVNGGAGVARNRGIDIGKSKYVLFLDADDELTPECVSVLTRNLESSCNDFAIGAKRKTFFGVEKPYYPQMFSSNLHSVNPRKVPQIRYHIAPHAKLIRRDFIEDNSLRFPEGVTYEDFVFSYELLLRARHVGVCSEVCYLYYVNNGSISTKLHDEFNIVSRWKVETQLWDLCDKLDRNNEIYGCAKSFSMNSRFWRHVSLLGSSPENVRAFLIWKDLIASSIKLIDFADAARARVYKNIVDMTFDEFLAYTSRTTSV